MKRLIISAIVLFLLGNISYTFFIRAVADEVGPTLSAEAAAAKWGNQAFSQQKFLKGSSTDRASMAADLIKRKIYVGKKRKDVWKDLGSSTGYFWNDNIIPAYILNEKVDADGHHWQLIFLPGANETVSEVKININGYSK